MKDSTGVRIIFFFIILLIKSASLYSQSPGWLWAKTAVSNGVDYINDVAIDAGGRILVTGGFENSSITFGSTVVSNAGYGDIFVAKYDASGNVLWATSAGGTDLDYGMGVTTDASGNVLVTGIYKSPTITFGTTVLTNSGDYDFFIVKYDGSGNVLWARSAGGPNMDYVNAIATNSAGDIIITGNYNSLSLTLGSTVLSNAGADDIFIVKYDASGNVLWANSVGGTGPDGGSGISTDFADNIFVSGGFESPSIIIGTTVLTNAGSSDIFTVKYNSSGAIIWANSAGGNNQEWALGNCTDADGNLLLTGYFLSSSLTLGTNVFTNAGDYDLIVVKYDTAGNVLWANTANGTSLDYGNSITSDMFGNVFITGAFTSSTLDFGATVLTGAGYYDFFVAEYDIGGNFVFAHSMGGTNLDYGTSISTDPAGNAIVTGGFASDSVFFGSNVLTNAGLWDIFIAKLDIESTPVEELNYPFNSFTVSPNPFTNQFKIIYSDPKEDIAIKLWDIYGSVIYDEKKVYNGDAIDTRKLASGIYFIELLNKSDHMVKKIIKQ
jgi:hypothetical protein